LAGGPARSLVGDRALVFRVDPPLEEDLVISVHAPLAEAALDERVDVEGGQVPLVEADRISQRDRARLVRLGHDGVEEVQGSTPIDLEPVHESLPVQSHETARCYYPASVILDSGMCAADGFFPPRSAGGRVPWPPPRARRRCPRSPPPPPRPCLTAASRSPRTSASACASTRRRSSIS